MSFSIVNKILDQCIHNPKTYIQAKEGKFSPVRSKSADTKLSRVFAVISKEIPNIGVEYFDEIKTLKENISRIQQKYVDKCNGIFARFLTSRFVTFFCSYYKKRVEETKTAYENLEKSLNSKLIELERQILMDEIASLNERLQGKREQLPKDPLIIEFRKAGREIIIPNKTLLELKNKKDVQVNLCDLEHFIPYCEMIETITITSPELTFTEKESEALKLLSKNESVRHLLVQITTECHDLTIDPKLIRTLLPKFQINGLDSVKTFDISLKDLMTYLEAAPDVKEWDLTACSNLTTDVIYLFKSLYNQQNIERVFPGELKSGVLSS